jgi:hypothetical protein
MNIINWRLDDNCGQSHHFCPGYATALVFLTNMVGDFLDGLHKPVRLAISSTIEVVSSQLLFSAWNFAGRTTGSLLP